ncbi:hypothetical protein F0562_021734 [Nyssa sinensis]|uniref:Uncharacterized protein n=1 Tax=Nyssa sinensis TaxID=561372 RepID=A0A5J5BMI6_9ASTE|nr:hypothetical protein F0562_021734 [Nyssa sinensis]
MVDASEDSSITLSDSANIFVKKLAQVGGDGSFFPTLEDDVIGVGHLLAEPKFNDLGDDVLGFDGFNPHKCFNIEERSSVEFDYIKADNDVLDSNIILGERTTEFIDGMLEGADKAVLDGRNNLLDTCEDYLLDAEFADEVSDLNYIPSKGSYMGNLALESQSAGSGGRGCVAETSELSAARIPVLEVACDQNSSLLDKMTVDELHEAFRNMYGRETVVMDKQWLKRHISFGLQNHAELDNCSSLLECHVTSNGTESKMILSTTDECSARASSPFTSVFTFKTKPRVQHVKRERDASIDSLKTLSSEVSKVVFGFPCSEEGEGAIVSKKRLRKPTRRYIEESLEQNSSHRRKKCGVSDIFLDDRILHIGSQKQHCQKGFGATTMVCQDELFKGTCIQVPFGLPVQKGRSKKKGHESDNRKDIRLLDSAVDSDVESFSAESHDEMSENDCLTRTKMQKCKSRRKHHIFWSLSEVIKLVEGVSKHGVGRWTEIKKLLFPSSANRTSVDLKDKWRNLLRASCPRSQSNREVESKRKHVSQSIPQSILRRVRELAVIHPYPRERKAQLSRT